MSVEVVKKMFEAFAAGDVPGMLSCVSADCQWDHRGPPGVPINQLYVGPDGVEEFFRTLSETQEVLEFDVHEFLASGDRVVVMGSERFRVIETGKEWSSDWAMAYTVESGLIKSWKPFWDRSAEVAAHQR